MSSPWCCVAAEALANENMQLRARVQELEQQVFPLEQLTHLFEAVQETKCGEAGLRECEICDYKTGPGEFDCLGVILQDRVQELKTKESTK